MTGSATLGGTGDVDPILGLRALRYSAEGFPGQMPAIPGLRVQAVGILGAASSWHEPTGQYRFASLPPGPRRLVVTDPERRFLPAAVMVDIPSRLPQRPTGPAGPSQGSLPRLTLLLRPAPARAIPPGTTAVIGRLVDGRGRGIALGRLACETQVDGRAARVVTWTDTDGGFALLLHEPEGGGIVARRLDVHLPESRLAMALSADPLGALPAGLDTGEAPAQFQPWRVTPVAPDGQPAEIAAGMLPVRPGRTMRWDLVTA